MQALDAADHEYNARYEYFQVPLDPTFLLLPPPALPGVYRGQSS